MSSTGLNFISSICWVKQGAAMNIPHKVKLRKEEIQKFLNDPNYDENSGDEGIDDEQQDIEKKYNMDEYDEEDVDTVGAQLAGLACFASSSDDPHLKEEADSSDSEDEKDAFQIQDTDNLIVIGRVDDDCATLEVYVHNEADMYVHHDAFLPAYPLCMEWLNYHVGDQDGTTGNYIAVGDVSPIISIWNLDVVDQLDPSVKLGRKEKKKKKNKPKVKALGHSDSVISLHWNRLERHILASGSADKSVLLWDLNTAKPTVTIAEHTDRVQSVRFHPFEAPSLLSASADGTVKLWDVRDTKKDCRSWDIGNEVESVLWDHFAPFFFFAACEPGNVLAFDVRQASSPVFTVCAHQKSVSCMSLSSHCPGLMVTAGEDNLIKVWDVEDKTNPRFVLEHSLDIGRLLSLECAVDQPFSIAIGGDEGDNNFVVFDLMKKFPAQMEAFKERRLMKVVDTVENKKTSVSVEALGNGDDEMESDNEGD